ncbi:MAG: penicillin acylase family protein [Pyrinomonadaceae bacterium]
MRKSGFSVVFFCLALFVSVHAQPAATEVTVAGLKDAVTVRRDGRSIPYIEAKSDADLYFAQGYVTASDRLWQMDLLRRVARGETAEIFGKSTLEEDKRWRRYGFARISEESVQYLDGELRSALENYSKGVNAYIESLDAASLPVEFKILQYKPRPWTPADTVVIGKILAEALSSSYSGDLVRESLKGFDPQKLADLTNVVTPYDVLLFGKDTKATTAKNFATKGTKSAKKVVNGLSEGSGKFTVPLVADSDDLSYAPFVLSVAKSDQAVRESSLRRVGLYAEELAASNNWVISGKRTADGKPILANDPHLMASAPGIWYLSHLTTPTMRVSGVTFPGVPGIVLGHNQHFAWGATNVGPDVQDLYVETFNEKGEYKTPEGWTAIKVRKEEIKFRANPLSPELTTETFEVKETRNGPVIIDAGEKHYALKWTALDPKNSDFNAFYSLNRASDWAGFKNALGNYGGAMQNFVYADAKGNIGWYAAGKVPLRKTGDGSLPYNGSTNDGEWTSFIPFGELPNLYNPPQGFIVTANQRIVGTDYKYQQLVRDFATPWRARRLFDLLSKDLKVTMDAVTTMQLDDFNLPLSLLAKDLVSLKALSTENAELVKAWDARMTADSRAALLVNEIRGCIGNTIAEANKPAPAYAIRERILYWAIAERSARWLPKGYKDYGELLRICGDASSAAFTARYGADQTKWVWGKLSAARFQHPLAVVPLIGGQFATPNTPLSGSGQTPNVASFVSMRHVASPGNWDATRHVIPLGQSGDPKSPFYKDQFEAWRTGTPTVFPFSKTAVESAAKSLTTLAPK